MTSVRHVLHLFIICWQKFTIYTLLTGQLQVLETIFYASKVVLYAAIYGTFINQSNNFIDVNPFLHYQQHPPKRYTHVITAIISNSISFVKEKIFFFKQSGQSKSDKNQLSDKLNTQAILWTKFIIYIRRKSMNHCLNKRNMKGKNIYYIYYKQINPVDIYLII